MCQYTHTHTHTHTSQTDTNAHSWTVCREMGRFHAITILFFVGTIIIIIIATIAYQCLATVIFGCVWYWYCIRTTAGWNIFLPFPSSGLIFLTVLFSPWRPIIISKDSHLIKSCFLTEARHSVTGGGPNCRTRQGIVNCCPLMERSSYYITRKRLTKHIQIYLAFI